MLAQWQNISLSFPDKRVLKDVSLTIYPNDRVALLGENGAGKTSLFRILTGELKPDSGMISRKHDLSVGYLRQTLAAVETEEGLSCIQSALEPFSELLELEERISTLSAALSDGSRANDESSLLELGETQERFEAAGGYGFRAETESALSNLGLPVETWERPVSTLSSGQKVRLALAKSLLGDHDLLLLDEPTNHLDIDAREWLEDRLVKLDSAFVVASHDRVFLDAVAEKVAYIERGHLEVYPGDYSSFRRQRKESLKAEWATYEKRKKTVKKLEKQARTYAGWSKNRERDKIGSGPVDRGFIGSRAARLMKKSKNAQRRLDEKIEEMRTEKPFENDPVKVEFHGHRGRTLLVAEDLVAGFDRENPLVAGFSLVLEGGERVSVSGPNGSGKTTLLRTLLGELPPLCGEVRTTPSAKVGYFDQENRQIDPQTTALAAVLAAGSDETLARTMMGRMRVRRETVNKRSTDLSAGERAKVLLTRLILGDYNLLVLDELTNHLDIETQDTLLEALSDFPGAILFVSHDRHFIHTLATREVRLGAEEP